MRAPDAAGAPAKEQKIHVPSSIPFFGGQGTEWEMGGGRKRVEAHTAQVARASLPRRALSRMDSRPWRTLARLARLQTRIQLHHNWLMDELGDIAKELTAIEAQRAQAAHVGNEVQAASLSAQPEPSSRPPPAGSGPGHCNLADAEAGAVETVVAECVQGHEEQIQRDYEYALTLQHKSGEPSAKVRRVR